MKTVTSLIREDREFRQLRATLEEAGFEWIGAYSDFEFNAASDACERIYIVARCKK